MWQEILRKIIETSRWRVICSAAGLIVGVLFILLGFFRAVFLLFCIDLGFYISRHPPCVVWTPVGPPGLPCVAVPSAPGASPG